MAKRIYLVGPRPGAGEEAAQLVRAGTQAQAVNHAVRTRYVAAVATQDQLVDLMIAGVKVQDAGDDNE